MLPSTFAGLVAFAVLLLPGFVYNLRQEQFASRADQSPLREAVQIVTASLLCDAVVLLLFLPVRLWAPRQTPSLTNWFKAGNAYWLAHDKLIVEWLFGYVAVACVLGFVSAHGRLRHGVVRSLQRFAEVEPPAQSAWAKVMRQFDDTKYKVCVYVGCHLEDGRFLSGPLLSLNDLVEETQDRELVLSQPILVREAGETALRELTGVGFVVISARKLVSLEFSHFVSRDDFPRATRDPVGSRGVGLATAQPLPGQGWRRVAGRRDQGRRR
ncbi:DUF6338 family protein [Actinospica robiniae]|uniref:DUF6338 family protein n=1 Tax=Actinospica robiniae TaxID=304901 RepID=UPI00041ADB98|nr:DUF6338 family protein [Actinospica robiniae]